MYIKAKKKKKKSKTSTFPETTIKTLMYNSSAGMCPYIPLIFTKCGLTVHFLNIA